MIYCNKIRKQKIDTFNLITALLHIMSFTQFHNLTLEHQYNPCKKAFTSQKPYKFLPMPQSLKQNPSTNLLHCQAPGNHSLLRLKQNLEIQHSTKTKFQSQSELTLLQSADTTKGPTGQKEMGGICNTNSTIHSIVAVFCSCLQLQVHIHNYTTASHSLLHIRVVRYPG